MSVAIAVDDVTKAIEELRAKRVTVAMDASETSVCFTGMIVDPDGNNIWLHQRKDGTAG